jgi:hypothetical protein
VEVFAMEKIEEEAKHLSDRQMVASLSMAVFMLGRFCAGKDKAALIQFLRKEAE